MKKIAWLFIIFAAANFTSGCGSSKANQACAIKADTAYYTCTVNPQQATTYWTKAANGLKSGQRVLVTWKSGYYDSESMVSCLLPGQSGEFLAGKEIYVPKRNIDFETVQPRTAQNRPGQSDQVNKPAQVNQSGQINQAGQVVKTQ